MATRRSLLQTISVICFGTATDRSIVGAAQSATQPTALAACIGAQFGSIWAAPFSTIADAAPGAPAEGAKYINTVDQKGYIYLNGTWVGFSPRDGQVAFVAGSVKAAYKFHSTPNAWKRLRSKLTFSSDFATLADADAFVAATGRCGIIDEDVTLTADTVLTGAQWVGGGGVILLGNHNLTFEGTFDGSPVPHFAYTGTGVVVFSAFQSVAVVKWIDARAGGATNDTAAVRAAVGTGRTVVFPAGSVYVIAAPIILLSDTTLQMEGANIIAACGTNPIFVTDIAASQIRLIGGEVTGTAGAFLKAIGATDRPVKETHYARNIYLSGVRVSQGTIDKFLWLNKAVRKVFVESCVALSANGILSDGKCVEIYGSKSLFYSGTSVPGTYGLKLISSGGTRFYNEGWYFTGCEVAAYEFAIYGADYFVFVFSRGLLQGIPSGHSAYFTTPTTTTHCFDAVINGAAVLDAPITVSTHGVNARLVLKNLTFANQAGLCIGILDGSSGVSVVALTCADSHSADAAVVAHGNNANIVVSGISTDFTFANAIQIRGARSAEIKIDGVKHNGSGQAVYAETPVLLKNVPIQSPGDIANVWIFNENSLNGTVAVSGIVASVMTSFAKGETGYIVIKLECSGLSSEPGTQRFDIITPAGITVPRGKGWSSSFVYPECEIGLVSLMIPYACDRDIGSGVVSIMNGAGNSAAIGSHSYFGIQRTV
jgi:hypothetical protein